MRKVHTDVVEFVKARYNDQRKKRKETKEIMRVIKDELGDYIMKEVGRQPMVIPMFVYITRDGLPVPKSDAMGEVD
ncbi:MAG: hypothetical protein H6765_03690 [Candidatus Peribacteria bacterium]|nr:MAG: hypothetical protein H6765_03690 [Candidatus Peribacteria bacterium]